ncbi:VOC family protein [Solicola sp. PLA-1-18]|uniref:VOC family protein n=1 Tax=Solicola sp. PLA-1-18 TaxID=3380532 RepID=UPI003B813F72
MPQTTGIDHLAVTVSDLDRAVEFYQRVLGSPPVGELEGEGLHRRIFALPGGPRLGLTRHDATASGDFDPRRPGLDHLGLGVTDVDELRAWADHLDAVGVAHSGLVEADYGVALSFTDPDGTALELFVRR